MATKGADPTIGDVFALPLDSARVGYGQVIGFLTGAPYVVVFREAYPRDNFIALERIVLGEIALLTGVTNHKFRNGEWKILGRRPLSSPWLFLPAYKMGLPGFRLEIVSLDGIERRSAEPEQVAPLDFPTISAPDGVEEALRVVHGLGEDSPRYRHMQYRAIRSVAEGVGTADRNVASWIGQLAVPQPRMPQQAVIVHLKLNDVGFGSSEEAERVRTLCDKLEKAVEGAGTGEFDGDEYGGGECVLYLYGPNADALFSTVVAHLRQFRATTGSYVIKRFGEADDPDAREERIPLSLH